MGPVSMGFKPVVLTRSILFSSSGGETGELVTRREAVSPPVLPCPEPPQAPTPNPKPPERLLRPPKPNGRGGLMYPPKRAVVSGAEVRVRELQAAVAQAKDVMDSVYEDAQYALPGQSPNPSAPTVQKWRAAVDTWVRLSDELAEAEQEYRYRGHHPAAAVVVGRRKQLVEDLMSQYGDHGPQYRLLVEMAATKRVRMEQMEQSGNFGAEYETLSKGLRDDIGQLQRYTEATKSEAIRTEVNQVGVIIMSVVNRHLHEQPTLFKRIVSDVRMAIEGGGIMAARELPPPLVDAEVQEAEA